MEVTTTYLQMFAPPARLVAPPCAGLEVVLARRPTLAYYRFLYNAVGKDWQWIDRNKLSDAELGKIIHDPLVEVHVLLMDGVPAGYAELDRRQPGDIELAYFGIMPEFIGQGLGKYLLSWACGKAWSYRPQPVLGAHLHAGSRGSLAELYQGGLRHLQDGNENSGVNREPSSVIAENLMQLVFRPEGSPGR